MPKTDITSGLLQVLLKCIAPVSKKRYKALVDKLMSVTFSKNESSSENILNVLENSSFARYRLIYFITCKIY
jgi:hypothetical protein